MKRIAYMYIYLKSEKAKEFTEASLNSLISKVLTLHKQVRLWGQNLRSEIAIVKFLNRYKE